MKPRFIPSRFSTHRLAAVFCWLFVPALFAPVVFAAPSVLLGARDSQIQLPTGGNAPSACPSLTPDGRFVVFSSSANDLTPGGNSQYGLNVFLRDRSSNTTVLVSANPSGIAGNDSSSQGRASTNGQFVVYQSDASDLISGDTNGFSDVFVRDLVNQTNILVSVAMDGGPGNGDSSDPVMTPDGRYVAFISSASNLTPNDTNGIPDVFVRDLVAGTTTLVSVGAVATSTYTGGMRTPVITPDGSYVAFFSDALGLAGGTPANTLGELYIRDLVAGTTTWASSGAAAMVSANLGLGRTSSYHPCLSEDGQYLAFKSGQTNLGGSTVILRYNLGTGGTDLISTNGLAAAADEDDPYGPEMSSAGRYVVFVQKEGINAAALTNGLPCYTSIHQLDLWTFTDALVSDPGAAGVISSVSKRPVISSHGGRYVVFVSNATNLAANAVSSGYHIYRRDITGGATQLIDVDTNGIGSTDNELSAIAVNRDASQVAFSSPDGSLVARDCNGVTDVFVRDTAVSTAEIVSARDGAVVPRTASGLNSISRYIVSTDGRWAAYVSSATDVSTNATNGMQNVFLKDLATGSNFLVSAGHDGGPALGGPSAYPVFSGNSRYLLFSSYATNLVGGYVVVTNSAFPTSKRFLNIYRYDLMTGTTALLTYNTNGSGYANADCSDAAITQDGRYIAFSSTANNISRVPLPGSYVTSFWRDTVSGATLILTNRYSSYLAYPPSLNLDGRYVAYYNSSINSSSYWLMRVFDVQSGTDIYTNGFPTFGAPGAAAVSPGGKRVVYRSSNTAFVDDFSAGRNLLKFTCTTALGNAIGWSSDGRFLAYVAATNVLNGTNIYLYDFQNTNQQLVSVNSSMTSGSDGVCDGPSISADGRFVVYRSWASNLVAGNTNPAPNLYMFDRLSGTNTLLTDAIVGDAPVFWNSRPSIAADMSTIVFLTTGTGWAANDLNRSADAFAIELAAPTDPTDSDHDGIPDWWMNQHFGHPTGQVGDYSMSGDDADGDGVSNLAEYTTGTDPRDAMSVFHIAASVASTNGTMTVSWAAVPGLMYRVSYKDNLNDPIWQEAPVFTWSDGQQGYFIVPNNLQNRFYRVIAGNW
ncbi:MAG: hypothetical protein U1F98_10465 [Verrucomicrobiota bacterium]